MQWWLWCSQPCGWFCDSTPEGFGGTMHSRFSLYYVVSLQARRLGCTTEHLVRAPHHPPPHVADPMLVTYTLLTRLAVYYLIVEGFYLTLWWASSRYTYLFCSHDLRTARLAILFSIIRIIPDKAQERFLYRTAIVFVAVLVFLLAQVFWVCEEPSEWIPFLHVAVVDLYLHYRRSQKMEERG